MATFNKFNKFVLNLANGGINLGSDTLWVELSNTAPVAATDNVIGDDVDIAAGNGYVAGGAVATFSSGAQTSGTYKLKLSNVVFTASGGTIGPFRYAILYDHSAASKYVIGYWDYGSGVTLNDGDTFTVGFDATNGVLTIA